MLISMNNINELHEALKKAWCRYTCAPRLRKKWNENNKACGQCSITAFIVQDYFGGEVYGVKLEDDSFHCFNYINGEVIDLTKDQFDNKLIYDLSYPQDRKVHFKKKEKFSRYKYLIKALKDMGI